MYKPVIRFYFILNYMSKWCGVGYVHLSTVPKEASDLLRAVQEFQTVVSHLTLVLGTEVSLLPEEP